MNDLDLRKVRSMPSRVPRGGSHPLAYSQAYIWYHRLWSPAAPVHFWHLPLSIRIKGELNPVALRKAWLRFIARHEAFRTTFAEPSPGQPVQHVQPSFAIEMPVVDLRNFPGLEKAKQAERLARQAVQQPFDLEHQPPLRIALLRLDDNEYLQIGAVHHLIGDGSSQAILLSELAEEYAAACRGETAAIAEPQLQFVDYAAWQREMTDAGSFDHMIDFWMGQLTPPCAGLNLPMKLASRETSDYAGGIERFSIAPEVIEQADALAFDFGTTRFCILMAGLYLLLHAWTQQSDLLVSVAVANRSRPEVFNNVVGCIAKQVPFRLRIGENLTFTQLVALVHEQSRQVLKNQAAPIIKAVERLGLNHAPQAAIGKVVFIYQNVLLQRSDAHGLTFEIDMRWELLDIAREDMVWQLFETPGGIDGWLEYRTSRFERRLMAQLTADYTRLLAMALGELSRTLSTFVPQSAL